VPQNIEIDIVFENSDFAIINKAQGIVVHPAAGNFDGTLVNALIYHFENLSTSEDVRPGIVHRLDKNTSGLLIVAKNNKTHNYFANLIKQRKAVKKYVALCSGYFNNKRGEIITGICRDKKNRKKMAVCNQDEGKLAITKYNVLEEFDGFSLVEFELVTGRTHQIRVHASHLKHPIVGDNVYGGNTKLYDKGQLLHSAHLEFVSPTTNKLVTFDVTLPKHFLKVLNNIKNSN
jgi:23S rRNA pseudouridine1911/1915/1917 synthase